MQRCALVLLCGLCALLAADAFSPSALPAAGSLQLRSGARPSLCSLQAAANDDVSRRSFIVSAAIASAGVVLPLAADAKKPPVEEEEEEEEEEAPAPPPKAKNSKAAAPAAKKAKQMYQGDTSGGAESASGSIGGLVAKAIAAAGVVGGGAFASQAFAKKYGKDTTKMLDKETGVPIKFGFTVSAENWNGRFAMLGFVGILVLELFSGKGITTGFM